MGSRRPLPAITVTAFLFAGLFLLPVPCPAAAGPGYSLAWGAGGVAVATTEWFKWSARSVPDGQGGAIVAWEENRFRRMCCRDTRDIYAQRVNAAGKFVWGANDVMVAGDDEGEECLGMLASPPGGALMLWRRGQGTLMAGELDASGTPMRGAAVVANEPVGEWGGFGGFSAAPDGRSAMLAWASEYPGHWEMRILSLRWDGERWLLGPPATIAMGASIRSPLVVAVPDGFLAVWADAEGQGAAVWAEWLDGAGGQVGKPFKVASCSRPYVFMSAAPGGPGRAWLSFSSTSPDDPARKLDTRLSLISRGRTGPGVSTVPAGTASRVVMFVPPPIATIGDGAPAQVMVREQVGWRRTAVPSPAPGGGCLLLKLDRGRLTARLASPGRAIRLGPEAVVSTRAEPNMAPEIVADPGGGWLAAWTSPVNGVARLKAARIRMAGGKPEAGPAFEPLKGPGEASRFADFLPLAPGRLFMTSIGAVPGGNAILRLQMLVRDGASPARWARPDGGKRGI